MCRSASKIRKKRKLFVPSYLFLQPYAVVVHTAFGAYTHAEYTIYVIYGRMDQSVARSIVPDIVVRSWGSIYLVYALLKKGDDDDVSFALDNFPAL